MTLKHRVEYTSERQFCSTSSFHFPLPQVTIKKAYAVPIIASSVMNDIQDLPVISVGSGSTFGTSVEACKVSSFCSAACFALVEVFGLLIALLNVS